MDRILITHSWDHRDQHSRLKDLLSRSGFEYYDHSITPDNQLSWESQQDLRSKISERISRVSSVIVLATSDIHTKPLVVFEIQDALRQGKRVIGVKPWGEAYGPIPKILSEDAHAIVGFNSDQIISAVLGKDIRNMSEYPVSETEDLLDIGHWIARSAGGAVLLLSASTKHVIPVLNTILFRYGIAVTLSDGMPSAKRFLDWTLIGGGIGALLGLMFKDKRMLPTLTLLGSSIGAGALVIKSLSLKITVKGNAIVASYEKND